MAENILVKGKEALFDILREVEELEANKIKENELADKAEALEGEIGEREKALTKFINDRIKSRREEIIKTFDEEEAKLESDLKRIKSGKEKYRDNKVSERIDAETASFINDNKALKLEAKKMFKAGKVPGFFNSGIFYSLFMPSGVKDIFICLINFLVFFIGIPALIWYFIPLKPVPFYMTALIYLACIAVFGGIYMLIFTKSRSFKYRDIILAGNSLRLKRRNNDKVVSKISNNIKNDKDDSPYGLDDYNKQIQAVNVQLEDLAIKKKEALKVFDEVTGVSVTEEIKNKEQPQIDELKRTFSDATAELTDLRVQNKEKTIFIAENYEVFLGKGMATSENIKKLISYEEETVAKALERFEEETER